MATAPDETALNDPTVLKGIPVFPPIAIRLLQLVSSEDVALGEVLELLRADPAFSAEILRRANSSLLGSRQPINTLQHALVVLGLRRVRSLTLTVASGMYLKDAADSPELRDCWRHTLACALLTEQLARACAIHEDLAYTAGLMHDIGRLGLLVAVPWEYSDVLKKANVLDPAQRDAFDLLDCEKEVFGMDHCAVGKYLVGQWKLPNEFSVVTGRHHDPPSGKEIDLLGLVYYGCQLADALGFAVAPPRRLSTLDEIRGALPEAARRRFPADSEELKQFVEQRIDALDLPRKTESPQPQNNPPAEVQPAPPLEIAASSPEAAKPHAAPRPLIRDIIVAFVCSLLTAGAFFLVVRLFAE